MAKKKSIKLAVICDGMTFATWQARCLENLRAVADCQLALLIINSGPSPNLSGHPARIIDVLLGSVSLWDWYNEWFVNGKCLAKRPVDLTTVLSYVPRLVHGNEKGNGCVYFSPQEVQRIREHELDVILNLSCQTPEGEVLRVARYGIWFFHFDDMAKCRGGPPCFWSIYYRERVTGAVLGQLTESPDLDHIWYRGFFGTINDSYPKNCDHVFFGIVDWPSRICRDIQNGVGEQMKSVRPQIRPSVPANPNNLQTVRFLLTLLWNYLYNTLDWQLRREQWNLGIVDRPIHTFCESQSTADARWLPAPDRDRYLADPFGVSFEDAIAVVAEEYDYRLQRGRISALLMQPGRLHNQVRTAIELPQHMSYPYLVSHEGDLYCAPEVCESREISLYKAQSFPYSWRKTTAIVDDFAGVDPTLFSYKGQWWLFCTDQETGPNEKLYAWHSSNLFGPWVPHSGNPLKTDIRSSRPAGTPFIHEGQLYRPAQDCSVTYGGCVAINHVLRLSPNEFAEETVAVVRPDKAGPFGHGLHTLSAVGNLTLIDGKRYIFTLGNLRTIKNRLFAD